MRHNDLVSAVSREQCGEIAPSINVRGMHQPVLCMQGTVCPLRMLIFADIIIKLKYLKFIYHYIMVL